jgi:hypothetical protein
MTFTKTEVRTKSVLFPALLLLFGASAFAQLSGKGEIVGRINDPSGAVVPGATVVATSTHPWHQGNHEDDLRWRLCALAA